MSAATTATHPGRAASTPAPGPTLGRVVAAEWTKLTSLRSPWWIAAVTVVLTGAITYLDAQGSSGDPGFQPLGSLTTGLMVGQLGVLVLGVLVDAGEYRTGSFRTTFVLVPRRWRVLGAQTLVMAAFALLVGVLTTVAGVLGILPAARSRGIAVDLTTGDAPGILLGMVLLVVGLALLGLAVGALVRRTVPALVATLLFVLVLPVVLGLASDPSLGGADPSSLPLPGEVTGATVLGTVEALTPLLAGSLMIEPASAGPVAGAPDLGPVGGGLVLAGWVVVVLAVAAVRLRSRDVR